MVKNHLQKSRVQSMGCEDPWRRKWQPTPVFLPGKFLGQRSPVGYSPWVSKSWVWLGDWAWAQQRECYSAIRGTDNWRTQRHRSSWKLCAGNKKAHSKKSPLFYLWKIQTKITSLWLGLAYSQELKGITFNWHKEHSKRIEMFCIFDCGDDYMGVYLVEIHLTVYFKLVHFILCRLCINQLSLNMWM